MMFAEGYLRRVQRYSLQVSRFVLAYFYSSVDSMEFSRVFAVLSSMPFEMPLQFRDSGR